MQGKMFRKNQCDKIAINFNKSQLELTFDIFKILIIPCLKNLA
jgi:hypothetical protein